ncbi:MAG: 50S ribosomal protein L3 [Coxiellaceae bacterium]|jgi:large subunit ribosomal protein L3|nr:50S ribosomal protein L3 [Coxiellaceae bacterium]
MSVGLIGKKCGMTRIFSSEGGSIPITVIEILSNRIVQIKTKEIDDYYAIQVTTGSKKSVKINRAMAGHFSRANVSAGYGLWEWRLNKDEIAESKFVVGQEFKVNLFSIGQKVDVSGLSKGKGFAGVVKRYHFAGGFASHGCSVSHRAPGSIGQRQTPGRVFKGKKMAGHLGNVKRTIQNQEIIKIDNDRNLVMIKGVVPGAPGGFVFVRPAVKIVTKREM